MNAPLVLVVDDQPDVQHLLRRVLEKMGCEVIVESDGNQAVHRALHDRPDLILMDMRLPGLDGLQVIERLRRKSRGRNLRVIALTGYAHVQTREAAMAMGCVAFFVKPVDLAGLRSKVAEILGLDHATDPGEDPPS
jgi:two-component system response regulator (stage 0 sporulation protein F)